MTTEYEDQRRDLEDALETLTEAAETAEAKRSSVYGWDVPDIDLDMEVDLSAELDEAWGWIQTVQEAAAEIASALAYARDKVQHELDNLHVEEPCDECGAVIVNDDQTLHEDFCEQKEV